MSELGHSGRPGLRSIRAKLLLYAAAVLVLPIISYGILAYDAARRVLEPSLRQELADEAGAARSAVQEVLASHARNVRSWARLDAMRELAIGDIDKTVSRFLRRVVQEDRDYVDVFAVDPSGLCVAASSPEMIGTRHPEEIAALAPGAPPPAPRPGPAEAHGPEFLRLAEPIPDPDRPGQRLGVLVARLSRRALDRVVHPKPGHEGVSLRLVDGRGETIAGEPRGESAPRDEPVLVTEVELEAYRSLPDLPWRIVAALPTRVAFAPIHAFRRQVLLLGSGVALVGLALAWLLSSSLSRPIRQLNETTARIAATGALEEIGEPAARDEIGELTRSFRKMVAAVAAAHDELVQSAKLAFLGEMAAGIAHEIRTPLGIIRSSAQLLERRMNRAGDTEGVEFARFIASETDRLNGVLTDLLEFARPSPPDKRPADLNAVVERALAMLAPEASSHSVELLSELAPSLPAIVCDANQMQQVCLNLVINAIQACREGGRVDVLTASRDGAVELVVRDDGPGIPGEIRANLFAPFTTRREGGIGLGLAIVKRIVVAHGGSIEAGDGPRGGAEFRVRLPLEPGPAVAPRPASA